LQIRPSAACQLLFSDFSKNFFPTTWAMGSYAAGLASAEMMVLYAFISSRQARNGSAIRPNQQDGPGSYDVQAPQARHNGSPGRTGVPIKPGVPARRGSSSGGVEAPFWFAAVVKAWASWMKMSSAVGAAQTSVSLPTLCKKRERMGSPAFMLSLFSSRGNIHWLRDGREKRQTR
jgi:hypothetical protein